MTRGRVCNLLVQFVVTFGPKSHRTHNNILLHLKLPNREDQAPVFISPRNRVAQLYPEALISLSVASYGSQGYDGSIVTHLHTGDSTYACVLVATVKISPNLCVATIKLYTTGKRRLWSKPLRWDQSAMVHMWSLIKTSSGIKKLIRGIHKGSQTQAAWRSHKHGFNCLGKESMLKIRNQDYILTQKVYRNNSILLWRQWLPYILVIIRNGFYNMFGVLLLDSRNETEVSFCVDIY
jgi:hypothetical protein